MGDASVPTPHNPSPAPTGTEGLLPALAMDLPTLMLALFALGLTNGMLDVAMNAQGVVVEQGEGHPVFSAEF